MSQCMAEYRSKSGRDVTVRWCTRDRGHDGDHRGDRVQWNQKGERVKKISLPADAQ